MNNEKYTKVAINVPKWNFHICTYVHVIFIFVCTEIPCDPASYRPISLLSNIGKLYEKVLTEPLKLFSTVNNIIPYEQYGFRDGYSTVHAITKLTSDICKAINYGQKVGKCLIDIEKFFDSVWTNSVILKMEKKIFLKN